MRVSDVVNKDLKVGDVVYLNTSLNMYASEAEGSPINVDVCWKRGTRCRIDNLFISSNRLNYTTNEDCANVRFQDGSPMIIHIKYLGKMPLYVMEWNRRLRARTS